jgi:hypothetical protein
MQMKMQNTRAMLSDYQQIMRDLLLQTTYGTCGNKKIC